jgi:signal peptidase I
VLVLGDARGNSRDGRYFGFVPETAIYARAVGVFWRDADGFGWREL